MLVGNQLVWNDSLGGLNTRGGQNSPLNKSVSLYKAAIVSLMASTVTQQKKEKKNTRQAEINNTGIENRNIKIKMTGMIK